MTKRSTRNRIKWQADKAINHMERAMENLAKLDGMAEDRSAYIADHMPHLVIMLQGALRVIRQFRDGL